MHIPRFKRLILCLLTSFLSVTIQTTYALFEISGNLDVRCEQSSGKNELQCDYRIKTSEPILSITAKSVDKILPIKETETYPRQGGVTAILFAVDTSDPGRQNVIEQNQRQIKELINAAQDHHRLGLASFDKSLRLEVPIGVSNDQILTASQKLRATGKTTEFYKSMLNAIDLLKNIEADRKSIFLFSDGQAEDTAYSHEDVIKAARKAGVVFTGLGFPRSDARSVALQSLRRLCEETAGLYVESDNNFNLPEEFLKNPYDSIDNGGKLTVDLSSILDSVTQDKISVTLNFETDVGDNKIDLPVETLHDASKQPVTAILQPSPIANRSLQSAPPVKIITAQSEDRLIDSWFWYGIPVALIILIILTIATFFLMMYRQGGKRTENVSFTEFKPYAYLVLQDETKKRYPITRTTWRIGRSKDNELTLRDNSISRRHAEIHRDKGDVFTVIDLDSLNGVYVNSKKVNKHRLHEGDILEIGDVNLRFTLLSNEYSLEESTVMQNTRAPITH